MNGTTIERTTIRATPGGDVVGTIPAQTQITFTQEGMWLLLSSAGGAARTGYVNARSVKIEQTPPPPPPDTPPAGKTITNVITVYNDGSVSIAPQ